MGRHGTGRSRVCPEAIHLPRACRIRPGVPAEGGAFRGAGKKRCAPWGRFRFRRRHLWRYGSWTRNSGIFFAPSGAPSAMGRHGTGRSRVCPEAIHLPRACRIRPGVPAEGGAFRGAGKKRCAPWGRFRFRRRHLWRYGSWTRNSASGVSHGQHPPRPSAVREPAGSEKPRK